MTRYVPKDDVESINAPPAKYARDFAKYFLFTAIVLVIACLVVGEIGEWAILRVPAATEARLLGKFLRPKFLNPKRPPGSDELFAVLSQDVGFPLEFEVECNRDPNAYSIPGGVVRVTSGLLKNIRSENGLSFVIEHEIGHFVHRDHLKGAARTTAFVVGAALLGFDATDYILSHTVASAVSRSYSRAQETEADDYALAFMTKNYGHVWGAEEFLGAFAGSSSDQIPAFLRSHPANSERRARIVQLQNGPPQALKLPPTSYALWVSQMCG